MFPGLEFRPTISNEGLIAFDFSTFSTNRLPTVNGGNVLIYYTLDGAPAQYNMAINSVTSVKVDQQEQDYAVSDVEPFIDNLMQDDMLGDSVLFIQGMAGTNAVVRLNNVDRLEGSLINGATLEVFGTALDDDELRPVPEQLVLRELNADGNLPFIRDFTTGSLAGDLSIGGGVAEDMGDGIFRYTFNVGSQLQEIVEGDAPSELYIRIADKIANMRRVVLFGAGHSTYPITLNVTYTEL